MNLLSIITPFSMLREKPKFIFEKIIITFWFFVHSLIIIFFIAGLFYTGFQAIQHYHNANLSTQERNTIFREQNPGISRIVDNKPSKLTDEDIKQMDFITLDLNIDWVNDFKIFAIFILIPSIIGLLISNFIFLSLYKIWEKK